MQFMVLQEFNLLQSQSLNRHFYALICKVQRQCQKGGGGRGGSNIEIIQVSLSMNVIENQEQIISIFPL